MENVDMLSQDSVSKHMESLNLRRKAKLGKIFSKYLIVEILSYSFGRARLVEYLAQSGWCLRQVLIDIPQAIVRLSVPRETYNFSIL